MREFGEGGIVLFSLIIIYYGGNEGVLLLFSLFLMAILFDCHRCIKMGENIEY